MIDELCDILTYTLGASLAHVQATRDSYFDFQSAICYKGDVDVFDNTTKDLERHNVAIPLKTSESFPTTS